MPKPFGYEDLRVEMARAGIDRAILIPPGAWHRIRAEAARTGRGRRGVAMERPIFLLVSENERLLKALGSRIEAATNVAACAGACS